MSLLIKALDQAAKNKEAERGQATAPPLNLTLQPRAEKATIAQSGPEQSSSKTSSTELFSLSAQGLNFAQSNLGEALASTSAEATLAQQSLEEEAGLSLPTKKTARSKYAKNETVLASSAAASTSSTHYGLQAAENTRFLGDAQIAIGQNSAHTSASQSTVLPPAFQTMAQEQQKQKQNQQTAAKVFVANQQSKKANSTLALFLLAFAGVLIILLLWQGYQMLRTLFAPEAVVVNVSAPPPTPESLAGLNAELTQSQSSALAALPDGNLTEPLVTDNANAAGNNIGKIDAPVQGNQVKVESQTDAAGIKASAIERDINTIAGGIAADIRAEKIRNTEVDANNSALKTADLSAGNIKTPRKTIQNTVPNNANQAGVVQLLRKSPADGVDPHLQTAYQAFTVGDFSLAQQQYRTVLQADVRNIDALLGMGAIAQRQNRVADANGWYQKILEIEPRNSIARMAMANMAVNDDAVATESRLKSMIAEQPNNANLYATLGNVYAEKNQWSSAQEAYFNACKLAPDNADYAFNLAVSLEQLRKPKLAYVQYLRALDLRAANNASSPDKAVLEARIKALSE